MDPQTRILQMSKASRKSNKFRISISAGEYSWLICLKTSISLLKCYARTITNLNSLFRLMQNRKSAKKCRIKRKEQNKRFNQEIEDFRNENTDLKKKVSPRANEYYIHISSFYISLAERDDNSNV